MCRNFDLRDASEVGEKPNTHPTESSRHIPYAVTRTKMEDKPIDRRQNTGRF